MLFKNVLLELDAKEAIYLHVRLVKWGKWDHCERDDLMQKFHGFFMCQWRHRVSNIPTHSIVTLALTSNEFPAWIEEELVWLIPSMLWGIVNFVLCWFLLVVLSHSVQFFSSSDFLPFEGSVARFDNIVAHLSY